MKKILYFLAIAAFFAVLPLLIGSIGRTLPNGDYHHSGPIVQPECPQCVSLLFSEFDGQTHIESALDFLYPWEVVPMVAKYYPDRLPGSIRVMYQGKQIYRLINNGSGAHIILGE